MEPAGPWVSLFGRPLDAVDPEIAGLVVRQAEKNSSSVNLVASETYCPQATLQAEASIFINVNASGYPGSRAIGGTEILDEVERIAVARAKRLFGAEHANVQSLSASIANVAVLRALLRPGDRILAFDMTAGGHLTHGGKTHLSGQDYEVETFGADEGAGAVDLATAERKAKAFRPRMIIAGSANFPRRIDFQGLSGIAEATGALLFADIAHVAGLIVAGLHPNPTPLADVVTSCTHKTLCGPRTGGVILCRRRHQAAIDAAVYPGLQAAAGAHIMVARAVLFDIVARPAFRTLMRAVVANARALADSLAESGVALYAGGTDTHMVVVDLRRSGWTAPVLNAHLAAHGLIANGTRLPRRRGAASPLGLRIGSVAMTIRGADAPTFREIGTILAGLLARAPGDGPDARAIRRLRDIARRLPLPDHARPPGRARPAARAATGTAAYSGRGTGAGSNGERRIR